MGGFFTSRLALVESNYHRNFSLLNLKDLAVAAGREIVS
jgi:hypothetical protein